MKHIEITKYFDTLQVDKEFKLTVSDRFPIKPFSYGQLLTLIPNINIVPNGVYLVIYSGSMFAANAKLANNVLFLTDLNGNHYKFTEKDANKVAVLARILSATF